jgi:diaminohydroxyphosphoribosylaminopyrimidine deaminase/5-amino-6-(5-phosphoribosylamino)uracil reductase
MSGDSRYLRQALKLAARGRYRVPPNPMVGAVVVRHGEVVGDGFHRQVGGPHAEVEALRAAGAAAQGACLYVTMEPCSHHGRTPPCVDAVIQSEIRRVVSCHLDPSPQVAGAGVDRLRDAGIEVEVGLEVERALRLNLHYLTARVRQRPAVTLKWAMSLDGHIATASGESQWISSPAGRRWALRLREGHDAVLVGSGTALADDPRLNRRLDLAAGPILRVVLDRRLRLAPQARMLAEPGPVLVYTEAGDPRRTSALEAGGATVARLPRVEPGAVLADLFTRGVHSLLVEGGGEILAAFLEAGAFDRVAVCCAPILIGGDRAPSPVGGRGIETLAEAPRLEGVKVERQGGDLLVTGYREGCLQDLLQSVEP